MDAAAARMENQRYRDKLMENNEAEKKRETKAKEYDIRIREISVSLKRNNS